jgi:hypothetical protein
MQKKMELLDLVDQPWGSLPTKGDAKIKQKLLTK